jgi:hypothetical protein
MKYFTFFVILFSVGASCFAQQLQVTSVQDNGDYYGDGQWPREPLSATARSQWDSLFSKYSLVRVESDPFESNNLVDRIAGLANSETAFDTLGLRQNNKAYTVYISWGNRRFICFIVYDIRGDYYTWTYEVK